MCRLSLILEEQKKNFTVYQHVSYTQFCRMAVHLSICFVFRGFSGSCNLRMPVKEALHIGTYCALLIRSGNKCAVTSARKQDHADRSCVVISYVTHNLNCYLGTENKMQRSHLGFLLYGFRQQTSRLSK